MPVTDDWGGVAVDSGSKPDDWGGIPVNTPKAPDMSGVQKTAQDNIAANDNEKTSEDGETKPPQTPTERLDTAAGMPVTSMLSGPVKGSDVPASTRGSYVKALRDGSASNFGDYMQSALRVIAPVASGLYKNATQPNENGELAPIHGFVSGLIPNAAAIAAFGPGATAGAAAVAPVAGAAIEVPPLAAAIELGGGLIGGLAASIPVAYGAGKIQEAALKGAPETAEALGQSPEQQASDIAKNPTGYFVGGLASNLPFFSPGGVTAKGAAFLGTLGAGQEAAREEVEGEPLSATKIGLSGALMGVSNKPTAFGEWLSPEIKAIVGKTIKKSPDAVTPEDVDTVLADHTKNVLPSGEDFKATAEVISPWSKNTPAADEQTLHVIFKETGVPPHQVYDDAQHDPKVAEAVADGKVPEAYEHLVEPKTFTPERGEKLQVSRSETDRSFNVVDADGDHVQGGFDSAEEARHYIEDKKFEAEERAAIEAEKEQKPATPVVEKTPQGEQTVLPGAEKISDKNLAERIMDKLKGSAKEQKPANEGLFDTGAQKQTDLMDVKPPASEPKLPKELAGAKPRYGYKDKQFTLKFESDVDRAAYTVSGKGESKAHAKYDKFLKDHGLTDSEVAERGAKVRDAVKAIAKDAEAGELTIKSSRGESPIIEKSQKHLTSNTIPPSEIGKPTSLYSFIRNNGKIKPSIHDAGDLQSQGHKELLSPNGKPADTMREMAEQQGYVKPGMSVADFHDLINDTNGGREHFRPADTDRILKAREAEQVRMNLDPARVIHEAEIEGLDTDPHEGETRDQLVSRLTNQLKELYKNTEGSARVRSATGEWLLTKPIEAVEKWTGKLTGGFFQKLGEGYIKTFQPELMGDKALRADAFMAKYKTAKQEAENSFYRASQSIKKAWDKVSAGQRMEWLYDHETGRWNEEDDPDHARYQALLDATFKAEKDAIGADADKGYKENYLPHVWENPEGVKAFFNSDAMIKKYGKDGFTKASTFQLIQDGIRAGFKLKSDNPESMLTARLLAGHDMIATMDLLKDMEGSGIAKPTKAFTVDKRIAKTEAELKIAQKKYQEAFEKQNPPNLTRAENIPPAVSKTMQLFEDRMNTLKSRLDDLNAEKDSNKLTPDQMKELKGGFKIIGPDSKVWNIHQEVAPLWKNAMEMKGLYEREGVLGDAYRSYTAAKSAWVAVKLGLSLFHPVHVAMINLASGIATSVEHLIKGGKFSDLALKDTGITMGLTKETFKGQDHPAVKAWNTAPEARTPEQQQTVARMIEGGFKPTMSARDMVHFRDNFDKAINGIGLNNLRLLGSAIQLPGKLMAPFFEHWIPGMKSEIYLRRTDDALARDPSLANDAGRRGEVFRQIAKDTDRTYGEMNNDVQFWNKTLRDAFNASFISGGWKLAQIYNARGLLEPLKIAGKYAKTGEFSKDDITHNMLQAYTYTGLTLALGGAVNAMLGNPVGGGWDAVKNLVAPQTGEKNPDGTPIRLNQPAFAKEAYNLAHEINIKGLIAGTGSFAYHQTLIPGITDVLNNQDFTGRELISDPTDLHQWMNQGWDTINPISVQGYEKAEAKGSDVGKVAGVLGFPLAGAYLNQTPFEQKIIAKYDEQNPPKGDAYQVKLKADLKSAIAKNDPEDQQTIEKRMSEEGMTDKQIEQAKEPFTKKFSEVAWKKLSVQDQKKLISSASDDEKERFIVKGD